MKESPRRKKQVLKKTKPAPETTAEALHSGGEDSADNSVVVTQEAEVNAEDVPQFDLSDSEWYLNRELTWLEFNRRVLHEAEDSRTPLLERLKFIAIVSANLDEFFMKRIGGLKQQIGAGLRERTLDGRTPRQQVAECHAVIRELEARKEATCRAIFGLLAEKNILIESYSEITAKEKKYLREFYYANIFPLLTPSPSTRPIRSRLSPTCHSTCWWRCAIPGPARCPWRGSRCRSGWARRA